VEAIEEIELDDLPVERKRDEVARAAVSSTAAAAAAPIAQAAAVAVPGMAHDELVRVAREVIERQCGAVRQSHNRVHALLVSAPAS